MKKLRGVLSVLIAVLIIVPFTIVNAEDATYSYEFVYNKNIASVDPEKKENATVSELPDDVYYSNTKYIFDGYYADPDYTTEYVFGPLTADTKIYLKFTAKSDIESAIKTKVDAANLKVTSTLNEKEGAELYNSDFESFEDTLTWFSNDDIPNITFDGYEIVFDYSGIQDSYDYYLGFVVTNTNSGYSYTYYYYGTITYTNSDSSDSELVNAAEPYNEVYRDDDNLSIPGLIDYTNIPNKEDLNDISKELLSEDETKQLYKDSVDRLKNIDKFDLVETDNDIDLYPDFVRYNSSNYFLNGDHVYGYLDLNMNSEFAITIDPSVENSHAAYVNSIKESLIEYLESKGYENVKIGDDEETAWFTMWENSYYLRAYYDDEDSYNGRNSLTIFMMKDYNTFLLAKNLTTNYTDQALYNFQAVSYSETKAYLDKMLENFGEGFEENIPEDIMNQIKEETIQAYNEEYFAPMEKLKGLIEADGYDFFEAYLIVSESRTIPANSPATLTFTVGTENNNRRIRVYHEKADGTIEKFDGIVKDGEFSIEVTEVSPFAVGLGEVVKALKNNPQTFDPIVLTIILLVVSSIGACVSMKLLKD